MKLYYLQGSCSLVPHIALEIIKQPYEALSMKRSDLKKEEYLALNPQGAVPVLQIDDFVLSQNVAILTYLDAKFPEALLFGTHEIEQKALAMRYLCYLNSDLHKSFAPLFHPAAYLDTPELVAKAQNDAREKVLAAFAILDKHLAKNEYLSGLFSVADLYLYVILRWAKIVKLDLSAFSNLQNFYNKINDKDVVQTALKQENLK